MSDGTISQDEIEALLSGVDMGGLSGAAGTSNVNIDTSVLEKFADDIKTKRISEKLNRWICIKYIILTFHLFNRKLPEEKITMYNRVYAYKEVKCLTTIVQSQEKGNGCILLLGSHTNKRVLKYMNQKLIN